MALIRTGDVQVGMELAGDVVDELGRLMIRAGTVLTQKELRLLKMWGIAELDVVDNASSETGDDGQAPADALSTEDYEPEARELFRYADLSHPVMCQLFNECLVRLARRGGKGERNAA